MQEGSPKVTTIVIGDDLAPKLQALLANLPKYSLKIEEKVIQIEPESDDNLHLSLQVKVIKKKLKIQVLLLIVLLICLTAAIFIIIDKYIVGNT